MPRPSSPSARAAAPRIVPPHAYFVVSALFHYLGPAFAVLLFQYVGVLGVAWLRIASAALVFALWRRPWRMVRQLDPAGRWTLLALGAVLGTMNTVFYLAIDRLPLGTVGAIEFVGPVALAAWGTRTRRNGAALLLATVGVLLLTRVRLAGEPWGFVFAFLNCALFMLYVMLGHKIAAQGGAAGIDRLGAAMLVAAVCVAPVGFAQASVAFGDWRLLGAAIGVGLCSSVIPYVCDQLAMARLPRASFAFLLSLLPAVATLAGVIVLRQMPTPLEALGVALVIGGVALRRDDGQR